jgi:NAD(P)H-dependent FMN reductase
MLRLGVIVGSVRKNRFAEKAGAWIFDLVRQRADVEVELLDLLEYPMPFFEEPVGPASKTAPYPNEVVERWTKKIAEADGFVIVSPEYNHGISGVLKNALDYVYREWNRKAVAFVAYGSAGGARAVEHLRGVSVELQMAPVRNAVHLPFDVVAQHLQGKDVRQALAAYEKPAAKMLDDLIWWTGALKSARARSSSERAM